MTARGVYNSPPGGFKGAVSGRDGDGRMEGKGRERMKGERKGKGRE